MDALKRECWFRQEDAAPHATQIDTEVLAAYVARGRANLATVTLSGSNDCRPVTSVSVKDASQGDVEGLWCGARSLLLEGDTGVIVCRGINKFFDLSEVPEAWMADPSLWSAAYRVWAVRKMAGFIVTVFSVDGKALEVMSKHALEGPHVDMARQLLAQMSDEHRANMTSDLYRWSACASFECIRTAPDRQHPVLESAAFDEQLVLIALQRRSQVREESLGLADAVVVARRWGLMHAPAVRLEDRSALQGALDAVSAWSSVYPPFRVCPELAEGFVLLIEPQDDAIERKEGVMATATASSSSPRVFTPAWTRPLRLKLKTCKYVVLRAFRSLVVGDSKPQSYLYHQGLVGWLLPRTASQIRELVGEKGVWQLSNEFEAAMQAKLRVRHRDAREAVGTALAQLQLLTARAANTRQRCPLTVLVLCGLPGAGKSSMSTALLARLASSPTLFQFAVHLSRDAVTSSVAAQHGIDDTSSKHKQRRLRAMVHREVWEQMRDVARLAVETQQQGLLILDACNATRASRAVWRPCFPTLMDAYQIVYVDCADATVIAQRAGHRGKHEVLRSAAEAQQALYAVRKKFQPPLEDEGANGREGSGGSWRVDTHEGSAEEAAAQLHAHLIDQRHSAGAKDTQDAAERRASPSDDTKVTRLLTVAEVHAELGDCHAAVLRSLLGLSKAALEEIEDVSTFFSSVKKRREPRRLQVRLDDSAAALWSIAAAVLCPTLDATPIAAVATGVPSLAATGLQMVRKVAAALWSKGSVVPSASTARGTLVKGHAKWLRGWLLHGKSARAVADVEAALQERFEVVPACPHVTLLHSGTYESGAADLEEPIKVFLEASKLRLGEVVAVRVQRVLVDRHAVCFGVVLRNGAVCQGSASRDNKEGVSIPLHITLGTTAGVPAAYTASMFASFEAWQHENGILQGEQQATDRRVNRSQRKFHNFIEYQLDAEVVLRGVVELQ